MWMRSQKLCLWVWMRGQYCVGSSQQLTMTNSISIKGLASCISLPRLSTSNCFCCKADRILRPKSFKAFLTELSGSESDNSWERVIADISTPSNLVTQTCNCGPFDDAEESLLLPLLDTRSPFISLLQDSDSQLFSFIYPWKAALHKKTCSLKKN